MRNIIKILISTFLLILVVGLIYIAMELAMKKSASYGEPIEFTCKNGLSITVGIESEVRDFYIIENLGIADPLPHIHGKVMISNHTDEVHKFSTKYLKTYSKGKFGSRGYKETYISEAIDFTTIDLAPKNSIEFGIYWPSNQKIGSTVENTVFKCEIEKDET